MTIRTALPVPSDSLKIRATRRIKALPFKHSTYCAVATVLAYTIALICYFEQQEIINTALYGGGSLLYDNSADYWFAGWVAAALIGTITLVEAFIAHGCENPRQSH